LIKYIVAVVVLYILYLAFFKKRSVMNETDIQDSSVSETTQCVKCGTYVDIDDSILSNGRYYCSQECM
jgi:uncharacterized protein